MADSEQSYCICGTPDEGRGMCRRCEESAIQNALLRDEPEQPPPEIREVFMRGGRYARCQFLTSWELDPPKYIVCHDVDRDHTFIATQAFGTWAQADVYLLADKLNRTLADTEKPE